MSIWKSCAELAEALGKMDPARAWCVEERAYHNATFTFTPRTSVSFLVWAHPGYDGAECQSFAGASLEEVAKLIVAASDAHRLGQPPALANATDLADWANEA